MWHRSQLKCKQVCWLCLPVGRMNGAGRGGCVGSRGTPICSGGQGWAVPEPLLSSPSHHVHGSAQTLSQPCGEAVPSCGWWWTQPCAQPRCPVPWDFVLVCEPSGKFGGFIKNLPCNIHNKYLGSNAPSGGVLPSPRQLEGAFYPETWGLYV